MSSIILVVVIASGIVAWKNRWLGFTAGCLLTVGLFMWLQKFETGDFIRTCALGVAASLFGAYAIPWFFSGFRGGPRETGPSFMGGGSGKGWGEHGGGIILSDEERRNLKK